MSDSTTLKDLLTLWEDGTIPRGGKGEVIREFNARFGFQANDTFLATLKGRKTPTPLQMEFLQEIVPRYYSYYRSRKVTA